MKPTVFSVFLFSNAFLISARFNGYRSKCGRLLQTEEKIVGGADVGYYKYPWYAVLRTHNTQLVCAGSLIGPKTVLTVAHCYKPWFQSVADGFTTFEEIYEIVLGVYNVCISEKTQKTFAAEKVIIHEKYTNVSAYHDIALIILNGTARDYTPICLPKPVQTLPSNGIAIGFGKESHSATTLPCNMREVQLKICSDEECRDMFQKNNETIDEAVNILCAGDLQGGKDTCQGDSGGPFQTTDEDGKYIVTGLVSFGFGCARNGTLGIYTYVANYTEWIEEKIELTTSTEE
ncbi:unnamed protein product [Tenebrio molitor]|nr:unnamed protein product [Tenebrio molitor]